MLRRVALVRKEISEEPTASKIIVARIGVLGTTLAVTSNQRTLRRNTKYKTLMMEALRSSETSVLTRATRLIITEDGILHSHRSENLKYLVPLRTKGHRLFFECSVHRKIIITITSFP
jgi:hypothetical protein